jgi:hypothetical protein
MSISQISSVQQEQARSIRSSVKSHRFSNRYAEPLAAQNDHFRDSIYNFNFVGDKDKVRLKVFDKLPEST